MTDSAGPNATGVETRLAFTSPDGTLIRMRYEPGTNLLVLLRDDGGIDYGVVGSSTILENSRCKLDLSTSSAVINGNTISVTAALTFKPLFSGTKTVSIQMTDTVGVYATGFFDMGAWTIP